MIYLLMILLFHVQFRKITNSTCENLPTGPKKFNAIQGGWYTHPPSVVTSLAETLTFTSWEPVGMSFDPNASGLWRRGPMWWGERGASLNRFRIFHVNLTTLKKIYYFDVACYVYQTVQSGFSSMPLILTCSD